MERPADYCLDAPARDDRRRSGQRINGRAHRPRPAAAPPVDETVTERVQRIARGWLERRPVYLDTETTGLGSDDEVVELAIIDHDGGVLVNERLRPLKPIPPQATRVHGIADSDVLRCPQWPQLARHVAEVVRQRCTVIYNAGYDLRLMGQSARAHGCAPPLASSCCAMKLYAAYRGEWDDIHASYRWHKLAAAAQHMGLAVPEDLHSARADAELTRLLVLALAD
ncbi:3'-5' exonuclease [Thiohalocapsa halophila]|nr:3'-5' exonuclease [Thiohalocapsa halophila]